ncbi:aldolase [Flaviflexus ciconiae]|uniref:Aldolase n=1 Tax=Flaviflexus ciconiae TaxID=2496867 RepID=A0A3S9PZQ6_9ACTO|nr:class II aldolase/adducin family protein [Flaviflexus ciconiae]AZQ77849.1 aldolase [Flaviflexus ciconiae]
MTDLVDDMLETAQRLAALGLSPGSTGNISCRVGDDIFLSASGTSFATLSRDDVVKIRDGHMTGPKPTKEIGLHLEVYKRNLEATAVIHLHSPAAAAASCLEPWRPYSALPPLTPYVLMRVGNLPLVPYSHPGSEELVEGLRAVEYPYDAVLLANHGLIASGGLKQAEEASIEIEASCRTHLQLVGMKPNYLTDQQCEELTRKNGRPWGAQDYR